MTTLRNKARAIFLAASGVEPERETAGFTGTFARLGDLAALYAPTGATRISDGATCVHRDTPIEALTDWARLHDTDPDYVLGIYCAEMERDQ
jgi:hypothetical protein